MEEQIFEMCRVKGEARCKYKGRDDCPSPGKGKGYPHCGKRARQVAKEKGLKGWEGSGKRQEGNRKYWRESRTSRRLLDMWWSPSNVNALGEDVISS